MGMSAALTAAATAGRGGPARRAYGADLGGARVAAPRPPLGGGPAAAASGFAFGSHLRQWAHLGGRLHPQPAARGISGAADQPSWLGPGWAAGTESRCVGGDVRRGRATERSCDRQPYSLLKEPDPAYPCTTFPATCESCRIWGAEPPPLSVCARPCRGPPPAGRLAPIVIDRLFLATSVGATRPLPPGSTGPSRAAIDSVRPSRRGLPRACLAPTLAPRTHLGGVGASQWWQRWR